MKMLATILKEHEQLEEHLYNIEMTGETDADTNLDLGGTAPLMVNNAPSEADVALGSLFPYGFEIMETPSEGFLCALYAICLSLKEAAKTDVFLPVPKVADLLLIIKGKEFKEIMMQFGVDGDLMNTNYFGVDQAALAAQMWMEERGYALRLGYVINDPESPWGYKTFLLPYTPLQPERVPDAEYPMIIFIHNNNVEAKNKKAMNHFSGIRQPFDPEFFD